MAERPKFYVGMMRQQAREDTDDARQRDGALAGEDFRDAGFGLSADEAAERARHLPGAVGDEVKIAARVERDGNVEAAPDPRQPTPPSQVAEQPPCALRIEIQSGRGGFAVFFSAAPGLTTSRKTRQRPGIAIARAGAAG